MPVLAAESLVVNAAEVENYGLLKMVNGRLDYHDHVADDIDITDRTDQIPGKIGVHFGIRYIVNSLPKGATMYVTHVIKFPGDGIQQADGTMRKERRWISAVRMGYPAFYGFSFDQPGEIVPGKWTFEVWLRQTCILRHVFTVKPVPASSIHALH